MPPSWRGFSRVSVDIDTAYVQGGYSLLVQPNGCAFAVLGASRGNVRRCKVRSFVSAICLMPRHDNNFDFIRLAAATAVLVSHQYASSGLTFSGLGSLDLGVSGVHVFFTLSGYLIAASWQRDPNLWRFLVRRVLRIWPGLIAMVLLTMWVLGPIVTTLPWRDYVADPQTWAYARAMKVVSLGGSLPGVFEGMPHNGVVNASLWTLPIEVRWYVILAVLGLAGLLNRAATLPILLGLLTVYVQGFLPPHAGQETLVLGQFFLAGAVLGQFRHLWVDKALPMACAGAVLWIATVAGYLAPGLLVLAIPLASMGLGVHGLPYLRRFGRFGDFSYGLYIYGFPIQQAITQFGVMKAGWSFGAGMAVSFLITLAMAVLSWHGVEKIALRFKP